MDCYFCQIFADNSRTIFDTRLFFVILDNYPVNQGHALIIPKRHQPDIFSLNHNEWENLPVALERTKKYLDKQFHPDGYNLGVNCGEAAGQSIFHLHIHLIPRYKGDVKNPRGGIRNFKKALRKY